MPDTQWPRYIVLHQEREGKPHQYAGSVHAPDAEIAMLNARDVFVRRPECVSLWVVRADRVFARTVEELQGSPISLSKSFEGEGQPYYIFQKKGQRGVHSYVGEVRATSPEAALCLALEKFDHENVLVWWVFPMIAVRRSTPEDIQALFSIAETKTFRDQGEYHTVGMLKQLRDELKARKQQGTENGG